MKITFGKVVTGVGIEPILTIDTFPEGTNRVVLYRRLVSAFHDEDVLRTTCGLDKIHWDSLEINFDPRDENTLHNEG